jgi:hypothetical protein
MNDTSLYASKRTARSLWQQYRIYRDRLELQAWILFRTVVVPVGEIRGIEVRPSVFSGRKGFTSGIKLDFTDLCRHVLLSKSRGRFKGSPFRPTSLKNSSRFAVQFWRTAHCPVSRLRHMQRA